MTVTWLPCYVLRNTVFGEGQWEVRPGLTVGPMSDADKTMWKQAAAIPNIREGFEPNFAMRLNHEIFLQGAINRLREEGHDTRNLSNVVPGRLRAEGAEGHEDNNLSRIPPQKLGVILFSGELLRWALTSISLFRTLDIKTPAYSYGFREEEASGSLVFAGCVATNAAYRRSMYSSVGHHPTPEGPINRNELDTLAHRIEIYFRPALWRHDPVSVALGCFWAFLFSAFPDQAYTSLVTILEALLSTGTAEISHQISERVAVLIGREPRERIEIYRKVKKLYDLRSRITHGDLEVKRRPITWGSTIVSAKMTIISIPILEELAQHAVKVLRAVLLDAEIMSAMSKTPESRKKALDEFFLGKLFGNEIPPIPLA
jgi:Apea-like HEPN